MIAGVVRQQSVKIVKNAVKRAITDEERARRIEAIEYARASVELEGFIFGEASREHDRRFIDGEITLEEYVSK